jgi:hypothetical protein
MTNTYGLLLRRENVHGAEYLVAELVRREDNHHAPRNCSDGIFTEIGRPKHLIPLQLDRLKMRGFVSSGPNPDLIGYEPGYYDVHHIGQRDSYRMNKTLKKINQHADKAAVINAVDMFQALCSALKLDFVVERVGKNEASSYDDNEWHWMSIGEGRNRYRQMMKEMIGDAMVAA